jgi:hypothetical protein
MYVSNICWDRMLGGSKRGLGWSDSGYPDQPAGARVDSILWLRQRQVDRSFLLELAMAGSYSVPN